MIELALESKTPFSLSAALKSDEANNFFTARWAVVEIALDSRDENVVSVLRAHLQPLHFGHAFVGIEHRHFRARDILKAFERRLARIPARRGKNEDILLDAPSARSSFSANGEAE